MSIKFHLVHLQEIFMPFVWDHLLLVKCAVVVEDESLCNYDYKRHIHIDTVNIVNWNSTIFDLLIVNIETHLC